MSRRSEREILRQLSAWRSERREVEPPVELLERLRAEIPAEVEVHQDAAGAADRSRTPARQRWLIAASLVAMAGMGLFALHLRDRVLAERAPAAVEAPAQASPRVLEAPASTYARPAAPPPAAVPPPAAPRRKLEAAASIPEKPPRALRGDAEGTAGGAPGSALAESAPLDAASRPAPPSAPVPQPVAPKVPPAESQPEGAAAGGVPGGVVGGTPGGMAGELSQADRAEQAPERFREQADGKETKRSMAKAIESRRNQLVQASTAPLAEGAPAPLADGKRRFLLRFRPESAPLPPGARSEVAFDPAAVARSRRIGVGADLLYEVELRPGAMAGATVATLRGVSADAATRPLRTLRVADLAPGWEQASPGFRLASLAAELEEILSGARPKSDLPELQRLARGLAAELPGDPRAADLLHRIEQAEAKP